jgi:hypothetical protein
VQKLCKGKCGEVKPLRDFHSKTMQKSDGRAARCKSCVSDEQRARRVAAKSMQKQQQTMPVEECISAKWLSMPL